MGDYSPSTSRFEVEANFKHREGLIDTVLETLLRPLQILTSPRFLQLYLRSILLFLSLSALLFLSSTASILFYYNYIPHVGHNIPIYLQFHTSQHPYSLVPLSTSLASNQGYDFTLVMHMPRTQTNKDAGNFMLDLALLKRGVVDPSALVVQGGYTAPHDAIVEISTTSQDDGVIVRSRRPAILPYASRVIDTAHKFAHLPFFLSGWRTESETLRVNMFEGVRFKRGVNPEFVQVTVQADTKMQFYDVSLEIKARFTGLRWAMYNHRILSFFVLTGMFFSVASTSTVLLYILLGLSKDKSKTDTAKDSKKKVKMETVKSESEALSQFDPLSTAELSDTAHTFPTRTGKTPLIYPGSPPSASVKEEKDEDFKVKEEEEIIETTHIAPLETITGVEGDDEDDGDNELFESAWRDSGIGTGVEDKSSSLGSARKRRG